MDFFSWLPDEILCDLLEYLEAAKDVVWFSSTCKRHQLLLAESLKYHQSCHQFQHSLNGHKDDDAKVLETYDTFLDAREATLLEGGEKMSTRNRQLFCDTVVFCKTAVTKWFAHPVNNLRRSMPEWDSWTLKQLRQKGILLRALWIVITSHELKPERREELEMEEYFVPFLRLEVLRGLLEYEDSAPYEYPSGLMTFLQHVLSHGYSTLLWILYRQKILKRIQPMHFDGVMAVHAWFLEAGLPMCPHSMPGGLSKIINEHQLLLKWEAYPGQKFIPEVLLEALIIKGEPIEEHMRMHLEQEIKNTEYTYIYCGNCDTEHTIKEQFTRGHCPNCGEHDDLDGCSDLDIHDDLDDNQWFICEDCGLAFQGKDSSCDEEVSCPFCRTMYPACVEWLSTWSPSVPQKGIKYNYWGFILEGEPLQIDDDPWIRKRTYICDKTV